MSNRALGLANRRVFTLPRRELHRLHRCAFIAQQRDHREVCGVVVANDNNQLSIRFLKNQNKSPYKYQLPRSVIKKLARTIKPPQNVLCTFHSHPVSEAIPGPRDIELAFFNNIELIYDVCGRTAKLWRRTRSNGVWHVTELSLIVK
jgi:proteasome lid subunit RPN8/RPN11